MTVTWGEDIETGAVQPEDAADEARVRMEVPPLIWCSVGRRGRMRSAHVIGAVSALCVWSCTHATKTPSSERITQVAEQLPQLDDGSVRVSVRSAKVTGALSRADALAGLSKALPHIQRAAQECMVGATFPSGTFAASFRTEPDGTIRMILEGRNLLTGAAGVAVVEKVVGSTMGHKWQFPPAAGPSLVEAEFAVTGR
jgi:hypothetical protein